MNTGIHATETRKTKFQILLLAVKPWAGYSPSLRLSFFKCKMVATSKFCAQDEGDHGIMGVGSLCMVLGKE